MDETFNRDLAITASAGCATGFLWSVLAGDADLGTGKGVGFAVAGCLGSAVNGSVLLSGTRFITRDPKASRIVTGAWFGFQSSASFLNTVGAHYGWHQEDAFNVAAFPLNYGASPVSSTVGLLIAGAGEVGTGFTGDVYFFGGRLVFHHELCSGAGEYQTGSIGHWCNPGSHIFHRQVHETAHMIQNSILGDFGMTSVQLADALGQIIVNQEYKKGQSLIERWARRYEWFGPHTR